MLKKLKKGKISEEEFDFELGFEQPVGGGRDGREYAENKRARDDARAFEPHRGAGATTERRACTEPPQSRGQKAKATSKPKHLKAPRPRGGGRGAKAMKKKKFGK